MPFSPRAGAVSPAPDKKKSSFAALESQLEKFVSWLHVRFPALPLCRSGQHFWLSEEDRSKCCNGFRRARVFLTVNARGHIRYYWREINSTDDKPFPWEPPPTNRSSRLVVRGPVPPSSAEGDDHVHVQFRRSEIPRYYDTTLRGGAILRRPLPEPTEREQVEHEAQLLADEQRHYDRASNGGSW